MAPAARLTGMRAVRALATVFLVVGLLLGSAFGLLRLLSLSSGPAAWKQQKGRADLAGLTSAISSYRVDTGWWPRSLDDLSRDSVPRWKGPYVLVRGPVRDPWGRPYVLLPRLGRPRIGTYGADGIPGGSGQDQDLFDDDAEAPRPP